VAAAAVVAAMIFTGCSKDAPTPGPASSQGQGAAKGGLPDRDPALAHKLVGQGAVLLDVRSPEEFKERHLDGAVNVPVDELPGRMGDVDKLTGGDKDKPIVVYCQAGGRAARAKEALVKAGHGQVTNLGGIDDWDRK
jgi:phage shock protein E